MAKLQIIPFEIAHLEAMQAREFEARELDCLGEVRSRFRNYLDRGVGYTAIINGQILMAAGLVVQWPGMAEAWAVTTALVPNYPLAFHRTIKQALDVLEGSMGLWRIQVSIHAEHQVSQKWIERLGFVCEGPKPRYGPDGATYIGYARLRQQDEEKA